MKNQLVQNVFAGGPLQSYLFVLYPMELKQFKNVDERWGKKELCMSVFLNVRCCYLILIACAMLK